MNIYHWRMMWTFLQTVISKKIRKTLFLAVVLNVTDEKSRIRIRIRWSEARFADPDPNPYQKVRDPEDCIKPLSSRVNQNMEWPSKNKHRWDTKALLLFLNTIDSLKTSLQAGPHKSQASKPSDFYMPFNGSLWRTASLRSAPQSTHAKTSLWRCK